MEAEGESKEEPAAERKEPGSRLHKRKAENLTRSGGNDDHPSKPGRDSATLKISSEKQKRRRRRRMPPWDGKPEFNTADQEFDAAQALFELLGGVSASIPAAPPAANSLHWKGKKIRSNRGAKSVCACKSPTSITVSSSRIPPLLLDLYSSSAAAVEEVVQEVIDIVKQEEEGLETEARSGTSAVDVERQQTKLLSESSLESMQQLNSRAESSSSPLPPASRAHTDFLLPKSESAFKQVEVDKIAEPPNKLAKVEQKEATQSNPRISQTWHQVVPAKAVAGEFPNQPGGLLCELSNGRIEGHRRHLMLSPTRGLTTVVNVEIRQREKLSPSVQGRKPSSEVEKEAHRVRRIQANRESARQAIQRKQVLCEELGRKAAELLAEKEDLRQKVDQQSAEYRLLLEMNMRLKEQVVLQADNKLKQPSCRLSSSTVPPMPSAPQFTGPLLPPFWWAFALAQATASKMSGEQAVSRTLALQNYPMLSIATTAFNNGNRFPDVWMGQDGSITTSMSALVHTGATTIQHFSSTTLDTQQPTSSVALPAIYTAHTKVLPDESPIVSIDREGDRNFERNTHVMRASRLLASEVEVAVKSDACTPKSHPKSSGTMTQSSPPPPLLSSVQPNLAPPPPPPSARANTPSKLQSHLPGIPYLSKKLNSNFFLPYRNGGCGMLGSVAYDSITPTKLGTTATATAAEARRRRSEELKRIRTLRRSRSASRLAVGGTWAL